MRRGKLLLTVFSILVILAGLFFLFYWDMREWNVTNCLKITCFIKEIAGKWFIR